MQKRNVRNCFGNRLWRDSTADDLEVNLVALLREASQGHLVLNRLPNRLFNGSCRHWKSPLAIPDSPQRAECVGDDDYFLRNQEPKCFSKRSSLQNRHGSCIQHVSSSKRFALATPCKRIKRDLINEFPDELLLEIFRFLPGARDRAVCASVCMRWLMLQSRMHREEFIINRSPCNAPDGSVDSPSKAETVSDNAQQLDDKRVERQPQWAIGDLSRCLEGKKATDVRLAAIAVGTGARGGLGKLSIRQESMAGGVTDIGLSAIGLCCPALRSLSLWDCLNITDEGLSIIGKGCRLLQKLDLLKCPSVGDVGLQSIAKNCPQLSSLNLDECGLIGNHSLIAISEGCPALMFLSVCNCPMIGDDGLVAVVRNSKNLKTMKLEGLRIGDKSLACIGVYFKALSCLRLHNLDLITEEGFMFLGNASGMQSLKRFSVSSCNGFSDTALVTLGNICSALKNISLAKIERISDQGLTVFVQTAASLEVLQLESCNFITGMGLTAAFSSCAGKLREVKVRRCDGIQDAQALSPAISKDSTVKSISLSDCRRVGNMYLTGMGNLCHQTTDLELTGLTNLSDEGLLAFLYSGNNELASVNLSGCVKLTDMTVCVIAERCGSSLRSFVLDGCNLVTDVGLKAIARHCFVLEDLDVSQCCISDDGLMALLVERGQTLSSLNLSGCGCITDQILPLIEERCDGLVGLNLKNCQGLTRRVIDRFESRLWKCDVFCS